MIFVMLQACRMLHMSRRRRDDLRLLIGACAVTREVRCWNWVAWVVTWHVRRLALRVIEFGWMGVAISKTSGFFCKFLNLHLVRCPTLET